MSCESCDIKVEAKAGSSSKSDSVSFPIWKMEDGRVFTDYLHRSAYHNPRQGSFYLKEDLKTNADAVRRANFDIASKNAQTAKCQPPPVPGPADVQICDARVCAFAKVDDPFSLGIQTQIKR